MDAVGMYTYSWKPIKKNWPNEPHPNTTSQPTNNRDTALNTTPWCHPSFESGCEVQFPHGEQQTRGGAPVRLAPPAAPQFLSTFLNIYEIHRYHEQLHERDVYGVCL